MSRFQTSDPIKSSLRKQACLIRNELPIKAISLAICQHLQSWPLFQEADHILFYYPFRQEVDLLTLMSQNPDKQWYLPAVSNLHEMRFLKYDSAKPLVPGKYAIPEPSPSSALPFNPEEKSTLFLIPGLVFDRQGYRIGYGKGYFDRFLSHYPRQTFQGKCVGILPEALLIENFPRESWDMPMDYLVTEIGILQTKGEESSSL